MRDCMPEYHLYRVHEAAKWELRRLRLLRQQTSLDLPCLHCGAMTHLVYDPRDLEPDTDWPFPGLSVEACYAASIADHDDWRVSTEQLLELEALADTLCWSALEIWAKLLASTNEMEDMSRFEYEMLLAILRFLSEWWEATHFEWVQA